MYRWIRTIHGWLGLALAVSAFVYAISGWLIYHGGRFPGPTVTERVVAVEAFAGVADGRAEAARIAEAAARELSLDGRRKSVKRDGDGWRAEYKSAAVQQILTWTPGTAEGSLLRREFGVAGGLAGLHRVHGAQGGPAFLAFAVLVDLVGVAMIGFACSGAYLWWKVKRRRALGWTFLGGSSLATLVLILQLSFGR